MKKNILILTLIFISCTQTPAVKEVDKIPDTAKVLKVTFDMSDSTVLVNDTLKLNHQGEIIK